MANIIRLKRRVSGSAGAPSSLKNGEIAVNEVDQTVWYGLGADQNGDAVTITAVAGSGAFVNLSGSQTVSGDKTLSGTVNVSGTLQLSGTSISATAAEINKLAGVTAGTASAGKALVVDNNKDIDLDGGDLVAQNVTVEGDLTVMGTTTTINSVDLVVKDKLVEIAAVETPTNTTANGGGIRIKGATDKDFTWSNTSGAFTSSEHMDLASGKVYKINNVEVLSATALGSGVVSSSLESVGILTAGGWEADTIQIAYGGTGATTAQDAINNLAQVNLASEGQVLANVNGDVTWITPAPDGLTSLNGETGASQTFDVGTSGSDFNISSSGDVHTFNIPDASASARGLVTTGEQSFAGLKKFGDKVTVGGSVTPNKKFHIHTGAGYDGIQITSGSENAATVNGIMLATGEYGDLELVNWREAGFSFLPQATQTVRFLPNRKVQFNQFNGSPGFMSIKSNDAAVPVIHATLASSQSGNAFVINNSSDAAVFAIDASGNIVTGGYQGSAVGIAYGGTGATTASAARENLGVEIGVDVQAYSGNLAALAGVTSASNKLPYFNGSESAAVTDLTSFGRDIIGSANAAAAQGHLELVPGVDVQPYDARLQALVDLTGSFSSGVVKLVGYSASSTAEYVDTTTFSRSLMDDASSSDARETLGLVIGTDVQAQNANLSALAGLTSAADKLPYFTGSGSANVTDFSSFGRSLVDDADASAARATLGVVLGTDVQPADAELSAIAGLTSAANKLPYFTGSGTADLADFSSFGRSLVDDADASAARSTLGLGTMAVQAANNVAITGGTIDNIVLDGGSY